MREDESFADDLNVYHGAVSTRVALLLRGAEAYPSDTRFVEYLLFHISPLPPPIRRGRFRHQSFFLDR